MNIFVNHIGYNPQERKIAVIEGSEEIQSAELKLIDRNSGVTLQTIKPKQVGPVDQWKEWNFLEADFSDLKIKGRYFLQLQWENRIIQSESFVVDDHIIREKSISDILFYFKSMRSSGLYNRRDKDVPVWGSDKKIDASGGWYDASGDTSKYLSHLSYAQYLNPQQIPMVGWNLLETLEILKKSETLSGPELEKRFHEEILQGADFVRRMFDPEGYFYMILFDQWSKETEERMLCSYKGQDGERLKTFEAAYRQGGGMAIAYLARTATLGIDGAFNSHQYLEAAVRAFEHLEENNLAYLDDGQENIIDDYCALLAAVELFKATEDNTYLHKAEMRVQNLLSRITADGPYKGHLIADGDKRPYFHASDAGLPLISLLRFLEICVSDTSLKEKVLTGILENMKFELNITNEVINPFGYARQYVKGENSEPRSSFFIPHDNPSGYWWQGENARLASLASAALKVSKLHEVGEKTSKSLRNYALNQIDWIVGRNPFNVCMFQGHGANNPVYERDYPNNPGGIANGITGGFENERDIDFAPENLKDSGDHSWRWGEQWIPHAGWFILAASLI